MRRVHITVLWAHSGFTVVTTLRFTPKHITQAHSVSRSPGECDLPPPSVLARTCLLRERQRRARARRFVVRTHPSHASLVLRSALHRQCSRFGVWRTRTPLTPLTRPRAANTTGSPRVSCPQRREGETWPLSRVLKGRRKATTRANHTRSGLNGDRAVRGGSPTSQTHSQRRAPDALERQGARRSRISAACSRNAA
jgi:hypothetical protein